MTDFDSTNSTQNGEHGARCSRPYHCPCGCGSHGECFVYGDEDEYRPDGWCPPGPRTEVDRG